MLSATAPGLTFSFRSVASRCAVRRLISSMLRPDRLILGSAPETSFAPTATAQRTRDLIFSPRAHTCSQNSHRCLLLWARDLERATALLPARPTACLLQARSTKTATPAHNQVISSVTPPRGYRGPGDECLCSAAFSLTLGCVVLSNRGRLRPAQFLFGSSPFSLSRQTNRAGQTAPTDILL